MARMNISKAFSPKILVAHVNAIIRRTSDADDGNKDLLEAGGIVIDRKAHIVTIDGQEIILSVKEFELLTYFMQNAGIALSRDRILNGVWNYDYFGDPGTIDTHVKKLRAKLGDKGNYIKTIWGMGYKFGSRRIKYRASTAGGGPFTLTIICLDDRGTAHHSISAFWAIFISTKRKKP